MGVEVILEVEGLFIFDELVLLIVEVMLGLAVILVGAMRIELGVFCNDG